MTVLTVHEVAALLKLSVGQTYSLTKKRYRARHGEPIPHFKLNGNLRFRLDLVLAWLDRLSTKENQQ